MNFLITALVSIFIFGLVIFIHELGHFITAKKCGVKVHEFALGMGPTIFKFKKGETTYALRLFPIGGFVQMEGEDEESDDARSFKKVSIPKRMLIIASGAIMNILLGFLALVVLFSFSSGIATRTVAKFHENASTEATGLRVGDTIVSVDGRRCFVANDILYQFARTQNGTVDLEVMRDGEKTTLDNVVFETKEVTNPQTGEPMQELVIDFIVFGEKPNFFNVIKEAFNTSLSFGRLVYLTIFDLITGNAAINELSGPVGIVGAISSAVSIGWQPVVQMLALLSINLGIANMLPIPAFDGGRFLFLIIEAIRKKPISEKYEIAITMVGFGLMILLMLVVSFNDIRRLFF